MDLRLQRITRKKTERQRREGGGSRGRTKAGLELEKEGLGASYLGIGRADLARGRSDYKRLLVNTEKDKKGRNKKNGRKGKE